MTRTQILFGAAAPTALALLGAAYVAVAYQRANEIVDRRAEHDALFAAAVAAGQRWATTLAAGEFERLPDLRTACADRLETGPPASVMAYVAPIPQPAAAGQKLAAGDYLVGWSTWGLSSIPGHERHKSETFSRTVLDVLSQPGQWQRLVWRRGRRQIPFIHEMKWLAVVVVEKVAPEVQLRTAVYELGSAVEICRGHIKATPNPLPATPRVRTAVPSRHLAFTSDQGAAIDAAIRYLALARLCHAGGKQLCAQTFARGIRP